MTTAYEFKLSADDFEQVIQDNVALQGENVELRARVGDLEAECANLRTESEHASYSLRRSEEQMRSATTQLNRQTDRIKQLEDENRHLRRQGDDALNETVLQMHEKLKEAHNGDLPLLQQKLGLLEEQLADAKQFNARAEGLIQDVRKQLATQISETERFKNQTFVQELRIAENAKLIERLQEENERLHHELLDAQTQSSTTSQSDASVRFTQARYEPVGRLISKLDVREREIQEARQRADGFARELQDARERVAHLSAENLQYQQQSKTVEITRQSELAQLRQQYELQLQQVQFDLTRTNEQILQQTAQLKRAEQVAEQTRAENDTLRADVARRILKIQQEQISEMDVVFAENKAQKAVIQQVQADLTLAQRDAVERAEKVEKLRKKVSVQRGQIRDAEAIVLQLKAAFFGAGAMGTAGMTGFAGAPGGISAGRGKNDQIERIMRQIENLGCPAAESDDECTGGAPGAANAVGGTRGRAERTGNARE